MNVRLDLPALEEGILVNTHPKNVGLDLNYVAIVSKSTHITM